MSAFYLLIGASLIVATGFLISFFFAVKTGQYEDDLSPSIRILYESQSPRKEPIQGSTNTIKTQNKISS